MFFSRTEELSNRCVMVEPVGDLDLHSVTHFKAVLDRQLAHKKYDIIINLDFLTFLDSSGLRSFIAAYKKVKPMGGKIDIVCSKKCFRSLFELTGLDRFFKVFEYKASAIRAAIEARALVYA